MDRLAGKVALITGAGGGMGRVAAERFAAEGAKVAVVDVEENQEVVEAIRTSGGEAIAVAADVRDSDAVHHAVDRTMSAFGALHVLYNNAGVSLGDEAYAVDAPASTGKFTMEVNVTGLGVCRKAGSPAWARLALT